METKRQLHVVDTRLADSEYIAGDAYTIADMAIFPWFSALLSDAYGAQEFLSVQEYTHIARWVEQIGARPAVQRGRMVNRPYGELSAQLRERHDASDFDVNREDMVQARGGTRN